jgi:hypothetical protein
MASRFWVGGTGTWDASDTTHWAATSNGAGGASVPGSGDTVTLDANSGGGTVTVNTTVTVASITAGAHTGTLDFSANNNNVNVTNVNFSGSGTRTLNLGNGTWTFTGTGQPWNIATTTNLTFSANSSTLVFTATSASTRNMNIGAGALTYSTITVSANTSGGAFLINAGITVATLNITTPNCFAFAAGFTTTVTNALNVNGTSLTSPISLMSNSIGSIATVSSANNGTFTYCAFRDMTFGGGGTFSATNSADLLRNSGITITAPSASAAGISRARAASGF